MVQEGTPNRGLRWPMHNAQCTMKNANAQRKKHTHDNDFDQSELADTVRLKADTTYLPVVPWSRVE
jgi:hypothetical protein